MSPLGDAALKVSRSCAKGFSDDTWFSVCKVLGPWRLKLTNDLLETNVGIQRGKEEGIATEVGDVRR